MRRFPAAAVLAALASAPAFAAETRTTFVATREANCQSASNCSVSFARTVAGKRLEIEHVACNVVGGAAMVVTNPFVSARTSDIQVAFRVPLPPVQKHGEDFGQGLFAAHYAGLIPIAAGRYAEIAFFAKDTTFLRLTCTISGHLYAGS